jgi:choline dehydrogenase-like flavoprotein
VIVDFDCVIVSAGAVGSVLANRLSEDPDNRVLLLEYGGRDTSPMVSVPERLCDLGRSELIASLDAVIRPLSVPASWNAGTEAGTARDGALAIMPGPGPQSIL